MVFEDTLPV